MINRKKEMFYEALRMWENLRRQENVYYEESEGVIKVIMAVSGAVLECNASLRDTK